MNWFEIKYRQIEVKFLGKKYCSMTSRNGHNLEHTHSNNNRSWERLVSFQCTVCGLKAYVDFTGQLKVVDKD